MELNLFAIFCVLAIICFYSFVLNKNIIAPPVVHNMLWFFYVSACLLFVKEWSYLFDGLLVVVVACLLFTLGHYMGIVSTKNLAPAQAVPLEPVYTKLKLALLVLLLLSVTGIGVAVVNTGLNLSRVFSLDYMQNVIFGNRMRFGYGQEDQPLIERAFLVFLYMAPLVGGTLLGVAQKIPRSSRLIKLLAAGTVAPVTLMGLLYGSRFGIMFGMIFLVAAYLATRVATQELDLSDLKVNRKSFYGLLITLALVYLVASIINIVRYNYYLSADQYLQRFSDPFTFFPGFANWFARVGMHFVYPETWGAFTFQGVFLKYVLDELPGFNYFYVAYVGYGSTNILTIFRDIIIDYGLVLGAAFYFLVGLASGVLYSHASKRRYAPVPLLTAIYIFIIFGVAQSPLSYTTPTASLVLYVAMGFWLFRRPQARA